uniref:hypothetical protein n=1 Tax=Escherichia coli TaxID=562 RepID=UPI0030132AAD
PPEDLSITINPINKLELALRGVPTLPQKMEIVNGANGQTEALNIALAEISYWCDNLLSPQDKDHLLVFLSQRATFSKERLSRRLGVLAGVA